MNEVATRVRELVSSSVDTLVARVGKQEKMLVLLRSEIEEALISLHGDLSRAKRTHERHSKAIEARAATAEGWTAKAKVAVDHGREDLARAALLARETERQKVAEMRAESQDLAGEIAELESSITELESKRADVFQRIEDLPKDNRADAPDSDADEGDSITDQRLDRIDALERRARYAEEEAPGDADIEAEIAALEKASEIEAELKAMKDSGKPS